ncbi:MAG: hypothetical protein NTX53_13405 [candidate division WOR-3 bacterium]|nr:hypothetical protein [candidate division WOR-3 bacterium]
MTRCPILSAVLLFCILPGPVAGQVFGDRFGPSAARPGPGAYALEGLGALGTGAAFALPPLFVTAVVAIGNDFSGGTDQTKVIVWGCVTLAAYAVGSGVGAGWVGHAIGWGGSSGWSYGLAMAPPVVSAGLFYLGSRTHASLPRDAGVILAAVGTPVLATVGFNISASSEMYGSGPGRFLPPSFAARMVGSPEAGTSVCFDTRLVSFRF